ncbi:MAG: endonuclease/exonuclease/phosphatase family protein [Acidimicrobiales bacterium]
MEDRDPRSTLTLATFNVHMGVDGWGRPFDVTAACSTLAADVLVMQESWAPDDDGPSTAGLVAERLGYEVVAEVALAHGRLYAPLPTSSRRWGPVVVQVRKTFRLDGERPQSGDGPPGRPFARGRWGLALLSRVPVRDLGVLPLGRLRRDPARRAVVRGTVDLAGEELVVCGTHMAHITHGSHAQYRSLARVLPPAGTPAVLAGDMNLWGPPTTSYLRGWRRAVTGRSWPAHHPHSQLDHVLVTAPVTVLHGRIAGYAGSDHRPAVVTLTLAGAGGAADGREPRPGPG